MSYYVYNSRLTYSDYIQSKLLLGDLSQGNESVRTEISAQTRELIATRNQLESLNYEISSSIDDLSSNVTAGFEQLDYRFQQVSSNLDKIDATLNWGFTQLNAAVGSVNDSLQTLLSIAKTPAQTWAYEQFEIARDAVRRSLYPEALESLDRAINGFGGQPGYKLEWRFHYLQGLIRLGDVVHFDSEVIDLSKAEQSFLIAGRYSETDYPLDSGQCFLCAGWAAYCQGMMAKAHEYSVRSLKLNSALGEASYQLAKIKGHQHRLSEAFSDLDNAIKLNPLYAIKAASDDDFCKNYSDFNYWMAKTYEETKHSALTTLNSADSACKFIKAIITSGHDPNNITKSLRLRAFATYSQAWESYESKTLFGFLNCLTIASPVASLCKEAFLQLVSSKVSELENIWSLIKPLADEHAPQLTTNYIAAFASLDQLRQTIIFESLLESDLIWKEFITLITQAKELIDQIQNAISTRQQAISNISRNNYRLETSGFVVFCIFFGVFVFGVAAWKLGITFIHDANIQPEVAAIWCGFGGMFIGYHTAGVWVYLFRLILRDRSNPRKY